MKTFTFIGSQLVVMVLRAQWPLGTSAQFVQFVVEEKKKRRQKNKSCNKTGRSSNLRKSEVCQRCKILYNWRGHLRERKGEGAGGKLPQTEISHVKEYNNRDRITKCQLRLSRAWQVLRDKYSRIFTWTALNRYSRWPDSGKKDYYYFSWHIKPQMPVFCLSNVRVIFLKLIWRNRGSV